MFNRLPTIYPVAECSKHHTEQIAYPWSLSTTNPHTLSDIAVACYTSSVLSQSFRQSLTYIHSSYVHFDIYITS